MGLRYFAGAVLALAGSVVLLANSFLLGSGAVRWAAESDIYQMMALAAGGATIPWLLAVFPMVLKPLLAEARFVGRLGLRSLWIGTWVLFFTYNFVMGSSNIAKLREDKVAEHNHEATTNGNKSKRREELQKKLDGIAQHRPATAVNKLLEASRTQKRWETTTACTDISAKASRDFCDEYRKLESEHESALEADRVETEIAALDVQLEASTVTTADNADPWVDTASTYTGFTPRTIRVLLSMATPVALEVAGAICFHFAAIMFGLSTSWKRKPEEDEERSESPAGGQRRPYAIPSPEGIRSAQALTLDGLTRARQFCEYFFREFAKPVPIGSMPETEWYDLYSEWVKRHHRDVPVPIENFRRLASRLTGIRIQDLGEGTHYQGYLPVIQTNAAPAMLQ